MGNWLKQQGYNITGNFVFGYRNYNIRDKYIGLIEVFHSIGLYRIANSETSTRKKICWKNG